MRIPNAVFNELLTEPGLEPLDWAVYLTAWQGATATLSQLAELLGVARYTLTRSCDRLANLGWLKLVRHRRQKYPAARIPDRCQAVLANQLRAEYEMAVFAGEFLMRKYLDMRICCDDYFDNARPPFLVNPRTGAPLEYDRYYWTMGVAFEFNGPQHSERTRRYDEEGSLREAKGRDLIKKGLSLDAEVALVTVSPEQLHPAILETLIPTRLPRRHVDTDGPYFQLLCELCTAYTANARSWRTARAT